MRAINLIGKGLSCRESRCRIMAGIVRIVIYCCLKKIFTAKFESRNQKTVKKNNTTKNKNNGLKVQKEKSP